jgi:hypothetical protein
MSTSTITLAGNSVTLVSVPLIASAASVEFNFSDSVAIVVSPYTSQTQAQAWIGADMWTATVTLPPLSQAQADVWISALMECRGMMNAIQIGDPMKARPRGNPSGTPTCPSTPVDTFGQPTLTTTGWTPGKVGLLLPGDYLQVGYRLHKVLDIVNSDSSGNASITVWPSLREPPGPTAPIILNNPMGLFRLATNKRTWNVDAVTRQTRLSFPLMEYR